MTMLADRPQPARQRSWRILTLTAVLLAAFALRIWKLGAQNIWWDEGLAIWAVRQGWTPMTLWTASDVHPPIYFWLLKAWVTLAGDSEFAARFISLVCGMVTVAAAYPLGRALLGKRNALLGLTLLAFSRFHVWWSQEMRMYIVATLWGVLSLYALWRWLRSNGWISQEEGQPSHHPHWREAVLYVLATAAGLYTLYLFVTILLIQNIFLLYVFVQQSTRQRKAFLIQWLGTQAAVLLLFLPWLLLALSSMRSWSVATPTDWLLSLRLYATLLTLGISTYIERYTWLVVPFFLILLAGLACAWRGRAVGTRSSVHQSTRGQAVFLLCLFLLIPPLVVYVLTQPRGLFYAPKVEARYLILFAPAFYLLLAWSMLRLRRASRWVGLGALAFVATVFLWTLPTHYAGRYLRDEHQTMARIIAAYAEPGDAVLLVSGSRYVVFDYYYGRLTAAALQPPVYPLPQHAPTIQPDNVEREVIALAASHPRLWLAEVNAPMEDAQGLVKKWLEERYSKLLSFGFGHNALTLFAPVGETARVYLDNLPPEEALTATLTSGVRLLGYDLPTREFRPGDTVRLALYYATPTQADITVCLVDDEERVLQQRRMTLEPADLAGRQQLDVLIFARTPGGRYHFEIQDSGTPDGRVLFGHLRIAGTCDPPQATTPPVILRVPLDDGLEFLGYALTDTTGRALSVAHPGQTLHLDLYWRAQHKVARDYTVFAHLVGQAYNPATAGPVWAGHDSQPLDGGYPTSQWFVEQTVVDRHVLTVDAQAPPGEYEIEAGMYLLETMARLAVLNEQGQASDNRIVLGHLQVAQP
ncbi:MAG: hypothetical protein FJ026_07565 [Chloroflexi bacterium]|nr:hypothetical protein [Chloroflexota bacterium]